MKLMYITNNESIAKIAESNGVDWIFLDLEINGKEKRQGHLDTVISRHKISDVKIIKSVLEKSKLLVRVNPIYESTKQEIDQVIENGADIIMLPYFKGKNEVEKFINIIDKRVEACLLLETKEAVENLEEILSVDGIDYIHIGLNDLHLSYNMKFMFEPLANGMVESIIEKIKNKNITYGFGGLAKLGEGTISAEKILGEHIRLGSDMVILSRSFYKYDENDSESQIKDTFSGEVKKIRDYIRELKTKENLFFEENQFSICGLINDIVKLKKEK